MRLTGGREADRRVRLPSNRGTNSAPDCYQYLTPQIGETVGVVALHYHAEPGASHAAMMPGAGDDLFGSA